MHVHVCMYNMRVHIIMSIPFYHVARFQWRCFIGMHLLKCVYSKGSRILRYSEISRKFVIYHNGGMVLYCFVPPLPPDKVQIKSLNIHIQPSVSTYTCSLLLVYHKLWWHSLWLGCLGWISFRVWNSMLLWVIFVPYSHKTNQIPACLAIMAARSAACWLPCCCELDSQC